MTEGRGWVSSVRMRHKDGHWVELEGSGATIHDETVSNVAPTLSLGGSGGTEGSPLVLTLGASDPGNDHLISWMINWGDGAQTPLAGTATSASHTYADNKIYNIVVTANDEDGYYSNVKSVEITNAAPNLFDLFKEK